MDVRSKAKSGGPNRMAAQISASKVPIPKKKKNVPRNPKYTFSHL
jgi:hypothetical protein